MATKTLIPVEEYLNRRFEGPEPDYIDGEIVVRPLPSIPHSRAQRRLSKIFLLLPESANLYAFTEITLKLSDTRFRIADLAVFVGEGPNGEGHAAEPPLIVIEILSKDDRFTEIQKKFMDYQIFGIRHIWLADPWMGKLYIWETGLRDVSSFELPEYGVTISPADIFGKTPK